MTEAMTNEQILESVICLLAVDGDVCELEMQFFRDVCKRLDVSKESAEAVLTKARQGKGRIYLPEKDADKKRLIYFLVQAVVVDKKVAPVELKVLGAVVGKLGLSKTDVERYIQRQLKEVRAITCPKCGYEQPPAPECRRCGIVFERYKQAKGPNDEDKLRNLFASTDKFQEKNS
jgi:uncharacterized tellurite resistance protein B-like protein